MADKKKATTDQEEPQVNLKQTTPAPQATPIPLWQQGPPGPPGAAVDPPPCSPSGTPFIAPMAAHVPGEHTFDGMPPPPWSPDRIMMMNGIGQPPWHPQLMGQPRRDLGGVTVQPALLGKETSPSELAKLVKRDHAPEGPHEEVK